jgi:hypothetical protein
MKDHGDTTGNEIKWVHVKDFERLRDLCGAKDTRIAELEAGRFAFARYVIAHASVDRDGDVPRMRDGSCVKCSPRSEMLVDGWECCWHRARALLDQAEKGDQDG